MIKYALRSGSYFYTEIQNFYYLKLIYFFLQNNFADLVHKHFFEATYVRITPKIGLHDQLDFVHIQ